MKRIFPSSSGRLPGRARLDVELVENCAPEHRQGTVDGAHGLGARIGDEQVLDHGWIDAIEFVGRANRLVAGRATLGAAEDQRVLAIPPVDPGIAIDGRPDAIDGDIAAPGELLGPIARPLLIDDRKSTRLNSSHPSNSYA